MNLDKIIKMFSDKDFPTQVRMSVINRIAGNDSIPSLMWSIANQMLMRAQGTNDARSERAWAKVGRKVVDRDSSKIIWVFEPKKIKVKEKDERNVEVEKIILVGFKMGIKWAVENTEGEPLEYQEVDYTPVKLPPLMEVAKEWGIKVEYIPHDNKPYYGYTNTKNEIYLCTTETRTFFHELAHQAHRRVDERGWLDNDRCEIIAELTSAVLCQVYGITGFERYSFDYVAHFAKGEKNLMTKVVSVLNDTEKILRLILQVQEKVEEGKGEKEEE